MRDWLSWRRRSWRRSYPRLSSPESRLVSAIFTPIYRTCSDLNYLLRLFNSVWMDACFEMPQIRMPKTTGCRLRRSTSKEGFEKITPKKHRNIWSFSAQTSKKYPNAFPVRRDGLVTSLWRTHNTSSASSDWLQPDWLIERTSDVTRCSLNEQRYIDSRKIKRKEKRNWQETLRVVEESPTSAATSEIWKIFLPRHFYV